METPQAHTLLTSPLTPHAQSAGYKWGVCVPHTLQLIHACVCSRQVVQHCGLDYVPPPKDTLKS